MTFIKAEESSSSSWVAQLIATVIACLAYVLMGFGLSYPSPAIPELIQEKEDGGLGLTEEQINWFVSLFYLGGIIGGPINGIILEKLGRKYGVLFSSIPFATGWFLIVFATNIWMLYFGRIVTGIGSGMASVAAPVYIAEVTVKDIRGRFGGGLELSISFGLLIAFCVDIVLSYKWLAFLGAIISIIHILLAIMIPESPRWYLIKGNAERAKKSLTWLRGKEQDNIDLELKEIQEDLEKMETKATFYEILTQPIYYKPLLISIVLLCVMHGGGISAISVFTNTMLIDSELGGEREQNISVISIGLAKLLSTLVTCAIVDKVGRRFLLLLSGFVVMVSMSALGVYSLITVNEWVEKTDVEVKVLGVGAIALFTTGFSLGIGPIPWIIMSEICNQKARDTSSSISSAIYWVIGFLITRFYLPLQGVLMPYGVFFLFLGVNLFGFIFYIFLPETKGKSLEEMSLIFKK